MIKNSTYLLIRVNIQEREAVKNHCLSISKEGLNNQVDNRLVLSTIKIDGLDLNIKRQFLAFT